MYFRDSNEPPDFLLKKYYIYNIFTGLIIIKNIFAHRSLNLAHPDHKSTLLFFFLKLLTL